MARNTDFIGFTFNGRHSSEFNIYSVSDGSRYQDVLIPNPIDYTEQVPGGVGQYYFGSDMDIKEFPLSIAYDKLTETQVRELRNWLAPDAVGELIFDERPYKTYTGKISTSPSLSFICFDSYNKESGRKERIYKGEGSINFVCYYPLGIVSGDKKELKWYREQIDDKIYKTIGGNSPFISYKLDDNEVAVVDKITGKTEQKVSNQGKNLIKISNKTYTNQTINGYSDVSGKNLLPILNKAKTYTYSARIDNTAGMTGNAISLWAVRDGVNERLSYLPTVRIAAGNTGTSSVTLDCAKFDWTRVTALYCGASIDAKGEGVTVTVNNFQFEEGTTATVYEPFVPDSPSPDYPSPITGVQPSSVRVCRKNLANIPDKTVSNAVYVGFADVYSKNAPGVMHMVDKSKIYTLSAYIDNTSGAADSGVKVWYTKNGTVSVFNPVSSVSVPVGSKGAATYVIDLTALNWDGVTGLFPGLDLRGSGEGKTVSASQVQFEAGDSATPFEPYAGTDYPLTLTTPMYSLPGGADEIDLVSGAETRRCGVITLDGTETWAVRKANATSASFSTDVSNAAIGAAYPAISTIGFRAGRYGVDGYEGATSDSGTSNRPQISVLYSRIGSSAEDTDADKISKFKVWLAAQAEAGMPVTIVYQLKDPDITKHSIDSTSISTFLNLQLASRSNDQSIINVNPEYYNYFTGSNANLSLRVYGAKYSNIDEWKSSTGMLEDLDTSGVNKGYDHYITLPDNTKGIQLYNPGDRETDFILSFNKPTPMNDILFTLSNGEQFMLNLRSSDTDVEDYGAVSDAEKRIAAMTGGVITIDTKKNRIMYKYGTGDNVTEESIYFALKKGQFFKIPKNRTSTGGYNLVIGTTSNIETDSIKISYDYLYY